MYFVIPAIILAFAYFTLSSEVAIYFLSLSQLIMLVKVLMERHLTGVGAFIFMSVLFFGVRPLYLYHNMDYKLFDVLFYITPSQLQLNSSMWWGCFATLCFQIGAEIAKKGHARHWVERYNISKNTSRGFKVVKSDAVVWLLIYQVFTLSIMLLMATKGRTLYDSGLGAYIYDLPALMQAGQVFGLLLCLERYLSNRSIGNLSVLVFSGILFMLFSWEMRNVSLFRSFYLSGVMIGGLAVLARLKPNVRAFWLIVPVVLVLPAFRMMGEARYENNETLALAKEGDQATASEEEQGGLLHKYWQFYDADGDMNIFDTFVAARMSKPETQPYVLSWLYVPFHLVPRSVWSGKPAKGTVQDMSFTYGAPYCPGIAGFFYLDGGDFWMLLSMAFLGYLLGYLDWTILTLPRSYLRYCLYGIVIVNGMLFSRLFLWQYFYAVLYSIIPCLLLNRFVNLVSGGTSSTPQRSQLSRRVLRRS